VGNPTETLGNVTFDLSTYTQTLSPFAKRFSSGMEADLSAL
jgi:hypothetical protein